MTDIRLEQPPVLRHGRDPQLRRSGGRKPDELLAIEPDRTSRFGRTSPATELSSVVLPAPFAPRIATPRRPHAHADARERLVPAIGVAQSVHLKHPRPPDRRGSPRGRAARRAGGPSAILRPAFITTHAAAQRAHRGHDVLDQDDGDALARRGSRPPTCRPQLARRGPESHSSSSSTRGPVASARASSTRFCSM